MSRPSPVEDTFWSSFAAWEKAASAMAESVVRDPRTLALGATLLRSQLLWRRAADTALEAALAPFAALSTPEEKR